jgi:hypothetical protein
MSHFLRHFFGRFGRFYWVLGVFVIKPLYTYGYIRDNMNRQGSYHARFSTKQYFVEIIMSVSDVSKPETTEEMIERYSREAMNHASPHYVNQQHMFPDVGFIDTIDFLMSDDYVDVHQEHTIHLS